MPRRSAKESPTHREPPGLAPSRAWGAYCLANDAVLEWALALFASLQEFAPDLPLLVVPFDSRQEALSRVVERLGYGYLAGDAPERFEKIGRLFYPDDKFGATGFRKLASFGGPFRKFLFLDSDVLLLSQITDLLDEFDRSNFDLVHFDTDVNQVYRPGPLRRELASRSRARGFNAGLFVSRSGLLDVRRFSATLAGLDEDWTESLVPNAEQPFLNFYADRQEWSLGYAHELTPGFCSTCWPAVGRFEHEGDAWRLRGSNRWDEGWRLRFAHWAGIRLDPGMPNRTLWEHFRYSQDREGKTTKGWSATSAPQPYD